MPKQKQQDKQRALSRQRLAEQRKKLEQGCCGCSDCNNSRLATKAPFNTLECFWELHKVKWKETGDWQEWCDVESKLSQSGPAPASAVDPSGDLDFPPLARAVNSGGADSEREYFSATSDKEDEVQDQLRAFGPTTTDETIVETAAVPAEASNPWFRPRVASNEMRRAAPPPLPDKSVTASPGKKKQKASKRNSASKLPWFYSRSESTDPGVGEADVASELEAAHLHILRLQAELGATRTELEHEKRLKGHGDGGRAASGATSKKPRDFSRATSTSTSGSATLGVPRTAPPKSRVCTMAWDGEGDPYLFYLDKVAHIANPWIVSQLVRVAGHERVTLIGAAAWGAYLTMPLNTEDLDFLIEGASGAELRGIIECVVAAIAKVPEVQMAIREMNAAIGAHRRLRHQVVDGATVMTIVQRAIDEAPLTTDVECVRCFHVKPNMTGWKVQLGHRTLVDVGPAASPSFSSSRSSVALSQVLPTATVWEYLPSIDPAVMVASPNDLLIHLLKSLVSGAHWRFQKDLPRLRLISHEAWMARARVAALAPLSPSLEDPLASSEVAETLGGMIARFDPDWAAVARLHGGGSPMNTPPRSESPPPSTTSPSVSIPS